MIPAERKKDDFHVTPECPFSSKIKNSFFGRHARLKIDCVKHLGKLPYFWQNHEQHPFICIFHAMTQTHNFVVKKYELRIQIDLDA